MVDFLKVVKVEWIEVFYFYVLFVIYMLFILLGIVFIMVFVVVVIFLEYIGYIFVLNKIVDWNYIEKLGLYRLILGDGVVIMFVVLIGGLLNIIYGENIGVLVIIKVFSVFVIVGVVVFVILFGFVGKINVFILSILMLVMGGILIFLFGIIVLLGLCMMVDVKVDFGLKWNLMIVLIILVLGIGGVYLDILEYVKVDSMVLFVIMGVLLNLVLLKEKIKEVENV